jgi:hypothetical protein
MRLFTVSLFILLGISCASFQDPVDESLLGEINQQEKNTISSIQKSIISKKSEKDASEKNLEISEQAILVSNARLSLINAQREYYLKKEKQYLLLGDSIKMNETHQPIKHTDDLSLQELANANYCTAKRNVDLAAFKVKEADLSVLVSQLDFEKAKIAREYQVRRYGEKYNKLIEIKKFEAYSISMQDNLDSRNKQYQKTLDSQKIASEKLKAIGYEEQK